jgi:hypothetical protein
MKLTYRIFRQIVVVVIIIVLIILIKIQSIIIKFIVIVW